MKNHNPFQSIKTAWQGFAKVILEETSFKYMLVVALVVFILMFCFPLRRVERMTLILTIFLVLFLDLVNSSFERILDYIQPRYDLKVKEIKDFLSAIVLLGCLASVVIGLVVFWPYITKIFNF